MINKIKSFLQSSKQELKRVEWPTTKEVKRYTQVVVLASIAISVYIFVLDSLMTEGIKVLVN